MKKLITVLSAIVLSFTLFCGGCVVGGRDGVDGRDGKDVSIYDIYETTNAEREKAGLETLTYLEFIEQYLSYNSEEMQNLTSLQATINRSLFSGVSIACTFTYTGYSYGGYGSQSSACGFGSGVIIGLDKAAGNAYIVTNCHVVYSSSSDKVYSDDIHVFLYGQDVPGVNYTITTTGGYAGNKYVIDDGECGMRAQIVATSISYDLALLKITGSDVIKNSTVTAASFSEDDILSVGQTVYTVGNAGGEGIAATSGIISKDSEDINLALDDEERDVRQYRVLRTDTPINGGNSGGALYNTDGKIVGIVNAKDPSDEIDNMGFALPVSTVKRVIASMLDSEVNGVHTVGIKRALFGITVSTVNPSAYIDENGNAVITESAEVYTIEKDSAAYGILQEGDLILNIKVQAPNGSVRENMQITRVYLITDCLLSVRKGDTVIVTVKRQGQQIEKSIKFDTLTLYD